MKINYVKCINITLLNKLGVLDENWRYFSTLYSESIWNGISIMAPALCTVVKHGCLNLC